MHLEYPPCTAINQLVKRLKGRSSRKQQQEFPSYKKDIGGTIIGQVPASMEFGEQAM